jgi:hypothetical protein
MSEVCAAMSPGLAIVDETSAMADIHERADQSLGIPSPWPDMQSCKDCFEADESGADIK